MKKTAKAPVETTAKVLLEKHDCPTPFHEVRTRFLGRIVTPDMTALPIQIIKELWGGDLPEFDGIDEVNELLSALVHGLWNDLTRHQKRSQPFRLVRVPMEPTAANLGNFGLVRLQELDGFIEGLFNSEESADHPHLLEHQVGAVGHAFVIDDLHEKWPRATI